MDYNSSALFAVIFFTAEHAEEIHAERKERGGDEGYSFSALCEKLRALCGLKNN